MRKPFVVISGLPGSGKTILGRRLAPALNLPFIDKDDILERLFELKGVGDAGWRRTLSGESDIILQHEATSTPGAVVASFWRLPGMPSDSGTPTDWLAAPSHNLVNVHCVCDVEVAASRFIHGSMSIRPTKRIRQMSFARSVQRWNFSRDAAPIAPDT